MSFSAWKDTQDSLGLLFERESCLPFMWENDKTFAACPPYGILNMFAFERVGIDEVCRTFDNTAPAGQEIKRSVRGIRQFTWSVQIESDSFAPCKSGWFLVEEFRNALRKPSVLEFMATHHVGLVESAPTRKIDYSSNGRFVSRAVMDVVLTTSVVTIDCPITFVEKVSVSSSVEDHVGTLLPNQLANEEMQL